MRDSIEVENLKQGTTAWIITDPARGLTLCPHTDNRPPGFPPEIEGHASHTSVANGDTITFHISTNCHEPTSCTLAVYRLGWYGGLGGREMQAPKTVAGLVNRAVPAPSAEGLVECDWPIADSLTIGEDWVSGVYVAKISTQDVVPLSRYIIFVVRDPSRASHFVYQMPVLTYQAYNFWGSPTDDGVTPFRYGTRSASLYDHWGTGTVAPESPPWAAAPVNHVGEVSFNRPYEFNWYGNFEPQKPPRSGYGMTFGAGQFFLAESNMVRWIEREGLDVTYMTDIDLHDSPTLLDHHKTLLVSGHAEYWSSDMRAHLEARVATGLHVGFFGANLMYWQVRLLPGSSGQPNRTVVCYKDLPDPMNDRGTAVSSDRRTCLWNDSRLGDRAEERLIGVRYNNNPYSDIMGVPVGDMTLATSDPLESAASPHWLLTGTGIRVGDTLQNILGAEVDLRTAKTPDGTTTIADSLFPLTGTRIAAQMTERTDPGGGVVLATGTFFWSHGLDAFDYAWLDAGMVGPRASNPKVQQITRNFLNRTLGA